MTDERDEPVGLSRGLTNYGDFDFARYLRIPPAYGSLRHRFAGRYLRGGEGWTMTLEWAWAPAERAQHAGGGGPTPGHRRRMSARGKQDAVLRLLRGEALVHGGWPSGGKPNSQATLLVTRAKPCRSSTIAPTVIVFRGLGTVSRTGLPTMPAFVVGAI